MVTRIRLLREEPYSQKEAEAAVGLRTDNGERKGDREKDGQTEGLRIDDIGMER